MSYFEWYETHADGTPKEQPRRIEYKDRRVLALQWRYSLDDLKHFLLLACAAPGNLVDVTHFNEKSGQLEFSARLVYRPFSDGAPLQTALSLEQPNVGRVWPARSR